MEIITIIIIIGILAAAGYVYYTRNKEKVEEKVQEVKEVVKEKIDKM